MRSLALPGTPEALACLRKADQTLGKLMDRVGPCTLKPAPRRSPFQALVRSVVYQQLAGAAAEKIFSRVLAIYPQGFPEPAELLATPEESLRAAGLSRAKMLALKDIATKTLDGTVPSARSIRQMPDEEIVERLTAIRGVGPWTVHMYLIFTLGRPDVLPNTDYGVRQGFRRVYGAEQLPSSLELHAFGERWRPHRTTAAWYLWRALELSG